MTRATDGDLSASQRLHALFDAEWEWTLRENPTWASSLGDRRHNGRWPDVSLEAFERRHVHRQDVLRQLDAIDVAELDAADRVNYRLFRREYEQDVEGHAYRTFLAPLTMRDGIQDESTLADALPFARVQDYDDWIARLRAFPAYMDQTLALMREGARTGVLHPRIVMQRVPAQIRRQIVEDPRESLYYKPFREFPRDIDEAARTRLRDEAAAAISGGVVPAYRRMLEFFEGEYLPACYDEVGVWRRPRGQELYAFEARRFTTTDLTPEQIHEIGLKEVARIRGEMEKIVQEVGWQGTFREFLDDLRTNPRFYYRDANELLAAYRAVTKKIDPELTKLFKRLPRIPYGVDAIPEHIAPDTTTAYYRPPSADGLRAGTYFVNLYRPEVRPKYEIEALSLHESVPGHHLQIALAMELESLPEFRRYGGYTAFVEGWALYAERLGEEMGLYEDPYSKFGQLTYEMWRAVRLVVDTGMHSFRWPRQRAIDYFQEHTAKTLLDIENEVDRYIAWPGQALAYKIGELKIRELRARAEEALGERFDIREFHDVVLSSGAVTLDVLESNVAEWIEQ
ncbi:MAG TPA: DUF885 domain-containing protein [Planctomycetaceae bacterium]|nr:DUF885 domain-containing protein [Planctomycetaceae bacterium]